MHTRRTFLVSSTSTLVLIATSGFALPVDAGEMRGKLALVVGKDSPVADISLPDLKRLYLGEHINEGGQRLIPLNLVPLMRERMGFDKAVLNMSPDAIARYWIDRKIRGDSGPPKAIDSADLLQRVVARLDGAIGYAPIAEIRPDMKVIRVDGKSPNDSGYSIDF
jgi:hypothetical protein